MDTIPTEDQEGNKRLKQHYTLDEANWNTQNILINSRIHILLKSTCMSPGDKMNLNKQKNIKIIPNILSKLMVYN